MLELLYFLKIMLRRWWLIAIPTGIAAIFALPQLMGSSGISLSYTAAFRYTAMQSMSAIERPAGDYQDIWLSSELAINAFTDWVQGSRFREDVAERAQSLGASVDPGLIGVAADNQRSLGQVFLSYPDGDALALIQQAAIDVLQTRSHEYYAQLGGEPAAVVILDQSPVTAAPPALTDRFAPLLRIGLGVLAGIGLAALAHYLDPILRRREDIEALGLPLIASIPRR
jgi:capsular polysaccharide biosynthesis protein